MPLRDESAVRHERAAFDGDMAAARAALEAGDVAAAVDLAVSPSHKFWYGKEPERFELLSDLHELVSRPVEESSYRANPWQAKLLAELYSVWPKHNLEGAFLKHNFQGPHVDERTVSAAESVQLAEYTPELSRGMPVALSRGRWWMKLWEVETGKVIRALDS
jgi:hypothetical protein